MTIPKSGAELWLRKVHKSEVDCEWELLRHVNEKILGRHWLWLKAERCKAQQAWMELMRIDNANADEVTIKMAVKDIKEHADDCQQRPPQRWNIVLKSGDECGCSKRIEVKGLYWDPLLRWGCLQNMYSFYTENLVYSTKPKQGESKACPSSS
jgi:hypothetical protein